MLLCCGIVFFGTCIYFMKIPHTWKYNIFFFYFWLERLEPASSWNLIAAIAQEGRRICSAMDSSHAAHAAHDDGHATASAAAKHTRGRSRGRPKSDTTAGNHEWGMKSWKVCDVPVYHYNQFIYLSCINNQESMNAEASHQRWTCFKGKKWFVWRCFSWNCRQVNHVVF